MAARSGAALIHCGSIWQRMTRWLACRLQEARFQALGPLTAPMPHDSAVAAAKTKGFPGDPFHAAGLKPPSGYHSPQPGRAGVTGRVPLVVAGL